MGLDSGIGPDVKLSVALSYWLVAFYAIAWYNCIELFVVIWRTFRSRGNLYFCSCVVATFGIVIHVLGFILKNFRIYTDSMVTMVMTVAGWICFVTGQSLVLYSRLHLVVHDSRILRTCMTVIICGAIFGHIPIIVVALGANSSMSAAFTLPYSIMEKIQLSIFFVQETFISVLYVVYTLRILRTVQTLRQHEAHSSRLATRKVLHNLIYVNLITTILDITLLSVEYSGHYLVQTGFKPTVYSVKLKLEFAVLNQLVKIVCGSSSSHSGPHGHAGSVLGYHGRTGPDTTVPMAALPLSTLDRRCRKTVEDTEIDQAALPR
ncbi:integral membrane protein [Macrophomina phaseolina]|uniref:Integral membrane protein n=1 Tax=Macrophomina phaseolina TaxID=35725 RepID=A0ABQ8G026_9PEZI|nr:integral membrane protein [Macrophomina phaseolina]